MPFFLVIFQSAAVYAFLLFVTRRAGRWTLAALTPVGYMSIALFGSAVETALYAGQNSLWAGLLSAATLMLLNKLLTVCADKWSKVRFWLAGGPMVLVHNGKIIYSNLWRIHLTEEDLKVALRKQGYIRINDVRLAILEVDGNVGVIGP
jgi:uncharacterized membrane protein YcaP (DUF421 family)